MVVPSPTPVDFEAPSSPLKELTTPPTTPPSATRRLSLALQSVVEDLVGSSSTADAIPDEDDEALKLLESITANNSVGEGSIIIGIMYIVASCTTVFFFFWF